jgi:phage/plasmid-associated DNA primase
LTYDLAAGGVLRESRREDYLTRALPVAFKAAPGEPTNTLAFLQLLMGNDEELLAYLLDRVIAPLLTGSVEAQEFFLFFGVQDAGKTTLLRYLAQLLSPFAYKIPLRGILRRRDAGYIRHDLAGLRGMRLAYAEEFKPGDMLDSGIVKDISGGGDITAGDYSGGLAEQA